MVDYLYRYDIESTCYSGSLSYRLRTFFLRRGVKAALATYAGALHLTMLDLYALIIAGRLPDSESLTCCNVVIASQLGNEPRTCPARVDIRIQSHGLNKALKNVTMQQFMGCKVEPRDRALTIGLPY